MDEAVAQLLDAAQIPTDLRQEQAMRYLAERVIAGKLASNPAEPVQITWGDVYDMRGSAQSLLCGQGRKFNCFGAVVDAVGSGLMGTGVGKVLTTTGLAMAGPPGWVLTGGLRVAQETFQCRPDAVAMAIDAGVLVAAFIPWCKVPGVSRGCVAVGGAVKDGAQAVAGKLFGNRVAVASAKASELGVEVTLTKASHDGNLNTLQKAVTSSLHDTILDGASPKVAFDGPGTGAR
jgi:hypothetical protein